MNTYDPDDQSICDILSWIPSAKFDGGITAEEFIVSICGGVASFCSSIKPNSIIVSICSSKNGFG